MFVGYDRIQKSAEIPVEQRQSSLKNLEIGVPTGSCPYNFDVIHDSGKAQNAKE